jgi:hypothetical protein
MIVVGTGISIQAQSQSPSQSPLSEIALFNRCYSHLTQKRLPRNHPLRTAVMAGQTTATAACLSVLNGASIQNSGANEGLLASDTEEGRAVLKTFNDFHRSWFPNDDLPASIPEGVEFFKRTRDLHDEGESALHLTRALFSSGASYAEVVTGTTAMEALRTNGALTDADLADAQRLKTSSVAGQGGTSVTLNALHVQTGDLLGVRKMSSSPEKFNKEILTSHPVYLDRYIYYNRPIKYNQSLGGGVLGTPSYLLLNLGRPDTLPMNGGLRLARRWSKAVMKDLMCRDLPAIRITDAFPKVQKTVTPSTPPFRTNGSCVACHATIDPMASAIRNLSLTFAPGRMSGDVATAQIATWISTMGPIADPVDNDPNYYLRPPNGKVFYRSFNGNLIDRDIQGLPALGQALAETDDLYVCAAARYFQFFTGIQVNLQDIGDPSKPVLNAGELGYRQQVINLGLELRRHQNLRTLVRQILESGIYRKQSMRD